MRQAVAMQGAPSSRLDLALRAAIEAIVLGVIAISPWPNASDGANARSIIAIAAAVLLLLWAIRLVISRSLSKRGNGPFYCLTGLFALSAFQMIALPASVQRVVAPGVAEVYSFFLPASPEVFPGEMAKAAPNHPSTVAPGKTQEFLSDLLVVCVLYAAVVHNATSAGAFKRLAWVCAINGALLSLLAFGLKAAPARQRIFFWEAGAPGSPWFGPFASRNTFPFIVNLCLGLALGLLAGLAQKCRPWVRHPILVWPASAALIMMTAIAISLSRGGFLAMGVAIAAGAAVAWRLGRRHSTAVGPLVWLIPIGLMVIGLFFWSRFEQRFEGLVQNQVDLASRYTVWRDSLRHVPESPWIGMGDGSFRLIEPMTRRTLGMDDWVYDNAHNEYVEALVEGGVVRLGLTLALLAAVSVAGLRNVRRNLGRSVGWLALGGLVGLWAIALHSFVDFGIHYPAAALLAAVVAAHVASANVHDDPADRASVPPWIALALALCMVALGAALAREGSRVERADRFERAALLDPENPDLDVLARQVAFLEAATRLQPNSYAYHFELSLVAGRLAGLSPDPQVSAERRKQAAREAQSARDLAPTHARVQSRLALLRDQFAEAPPAVWYLERALRSAATDPAIWHARGKQRLDAGDADGAWSDWRQSLALSDRYLRFILPEALAHLSPDEFLEKVLPDRPEIIHAVSTWFLKNTPVPKFMLVPYHVRGLALFDAKGGALSPAEDEMRGDMLHEMGRDRDAVVALRRAVAREPALIERRLKLARVLYDLAKEENDDAELFREARRETAAVLARDPANREAQDRAALLDRELKLLE
jgi:O-antigen ligase